jgi:AcrR family transcriptional regulator
MNKKLTERGSKRREQIIDAAFRLFAEQGYHGTTVGDICDDLGVGKGVFYWYFESKESLFRELLRTCLLHLRRAQEAAIEGVADPVERIERGIRASIEFFRGDPAYLNVIRTAARYEGFSGALYEGQEVVVTDVAIHVKEGMSAGSIRAGDPDLMAHGILGAIYHFVEVYLGTSADPSGGRPQLADEAITFCMRGILT